MSILDADIRGDRPLNARESELARRILSDPFGWPPEFMQAIRSKLEQTPPYLTADQIVNFNRSALSAAPAIPSVVLALSASAVDTDLPKPVAPHATYMLGPGGGSIRSIAEPTWEGTRVTLKNDSVAAITLDHNDVSGGPTARPLLFGAGAAFTLAPGAAVDLAYVDTFWQDVSEVGTPVPVGVGVDGWVASGETWTFGTTDGPTFTVTTPGDKTGKYAPGQRIKLTHAAATKYFIVTAVAFAAGTTTITLYGGTTYTLAATAITNVSYSMMKVPFGFDPDPALWTVETISTANDAQGAAVASTWYNVGARSISIPIGIWRVYYEVVLQCDSDDDVTNAVYSTLSSANNSESDLEMTALSFDQASGGAGSGLQTVHREKPLKLAAKASRFLNIMTSNGGSTISTRGDIGRTVIRAVCAYL